MKQKIDTIFRLRNFIAYSTRVIIACCLVLYCTQQVSAQYANFEWVKGMGGTGADQGNGVAIDANGNVYVTGSFISAADFAIGSQLISAGGNDVFLAKYDPTGALLWAKSMGGVGNDYGYGVAVIANGDVYVTGYFGEQGADFNPGGSGGALTSAGKDDIFLAKYSSTGTFLWAKSMGGPRGDYSKGIAVDVNGDVYISGNFSKDGADFNPGGSGGAFTSAGGEDVFVAKYSSTGTFLWAKSMGGSSSDYSEGGVAVDANGNVYVTASFSSSANFNPGGSGGVLTAAGGNDAFLAKYSSTGTFLWAKNMGGSDGDIGVGVAADATGNVYVTGYFKSAAADFNPGGSGGILTPVGNYDVFVAKYNSTGTYLWAKSMGGADIDYGSGIAVDATGNVYITGYFLSAIDFNIGGIGGAFTSAGGNDAFLAKYDPAGTFFWAKSMGGAQSDAGARVAVGANDNVYAIGRFDYRGAYFNPGGGSGPGGNTGWLTGVGNNDAFVVKFSQRCENTVTLTESACDSFIFNGTTYTASGVYIDTFISSANCDSIITLNLTIAGQASNNPVVSGLYCDSITFNGVTYTATGIYTQAYTNSGGCDSNITYDITINTAEASVTRTGATLTANNASAYQWLNCGDNSIIPGATGQSYTATQNGNYAVVITINACTDTSDCTLVDNITGINELATGNTISLYPNPAGSMITIQTQQALKQATIRLVNMVGQVLLEQAGVSGTTFTIDLSGFAAGIYMLEVSGNGNDIKAKVVKQ